MARPGIVCVGLLLAARAAAQNAGTTSGSTESTSPPCDGSYFTDENPWDYYINGTLTLCGINVSAEMYAFLVYNNSMAHLRQELLDRSGNRAIPAGTTEWVLGNNYRYAAALNGWIGNRIHVYQGDPNVTQAPLLASIDFYDWGPNRPTMYGLVPTFTDVDPRTGYVAGVVTFDLTYYAELAADLASVRGYNLWVVNSSDTENLYWNSTILNENLGWRVASRDEMSYANRVSIGRGQTGVFVGERRHLGIVPWNDQGNMNYPQFYEIQDYTTTTTTTTQGHFANAHCDYEIGQAIEVKCHTPSAWHRATVHMVEASSCGITASYNRTGHTYHCRPVEWRTPQNGYPKCEDYGGIGRGDACCAASCLTCGGYACHRRSGGRQSCCVMQIPASRVCGPFDAPCKLSANSTEEKRRLMSAALAEEESDYILV